MRSDVVNHLATHVMTWALGAAGLSIGACGDDAAQGTSESADDTEGDSTAEPSRPLCGDGLLEAGEVCEPPIHGAACNPATCQANDGFTCMTVMPEGGGRGFFMSAVCTPDASVVCGNGTLDGGEACDDFNLDDGDGCSSTCQLEPGWECSETTPTNCAQCGDGIAQYGLEECDAGMETAPGCTVDCMTEVGWQCTQNDLCAPICGDGIVLDADDGVPPFFVEACDDGNGITGDGCTSACQLEIGWECEGSPSNCTQLFSCGDGIVEGTEECDDGTDNTNSIPDACRTNCRDAHCGDLVVDTDEDCDDGNAIDDDACSNNCGYTTEVDCTNGTDDDGDTLLDCADQDCFGAGTDCDPELVCDDSQDQDGDLDVDCDDVDCVNDPACAPSCGYIGDPGEPNQTPGAATLLGPPTMAYAPAGVLCSVDIDHYRLDAFFDPTGCQVSVTLDLPSLNPAGASVELQLLDPTALANPLATGTLSAADNGPIVFDANGHLQAIIIEANTPSATEVAYTLVVSPTCI